MTECCCRTKHFKKRGNSTNLHIKQKDADFVQHIWNLFDSIGIVGASPKTTDHYDKRTGKTDSPLDSLRLPCPTSLNLTHNGTLKSLVKTSRFSLLTLLIC